MVSYVLMQYSSIHWLRLLHQMQKIGDDDDVRLLLQLLKTSSDLYQLVLITYIVLATRLTLDDNGILVHDENVGYIVSI